MEEVIFALAAPDDLPAIRSLLAQCQLPEEDIAAHLGNFVAARADGDLIGVIGLEVCGRAGLLRSLAVAPARRGRGVGRALYDRILAQAHFKRVTELYLLTLTAAAYFARLGFRQTDRAGAPESIQVTREFQTLCPQTATCMMRRLDSRLC
jgi:amino-acid N-acetyltransferase